MKKYFILALILCSCAFKGMAQDYVKLNYEVKPAFPNFFLGFGGGVNNYLGLIGVSGEYHLASKFSAFGGLGLGSWGNKASVGLRYYSDYPQRWALGAGLSFSGGVNELKLTMPEGTVVGKTGDTDVLFNLKSAATLNLSANRFWFLNSKKTNRFNVELGYAVPLGNRRFEVLNNGYQLTRDGLYFMDIMQPGGFNLGIGFSFGLNQ